MPGPSCLPAFLPLPHLPYPPHLPYLPYLPYPPSLIVIVVVTHHLDPTEHVAQKVRQHSANDEMAALFVKLHDLNPVEQWHGLLVRRAPCSDPALHTGDPRGR